MLCKIIDKLVNSALCFFCYDIQVYKSNEQSNYVDKKINDAIYPLYKGHHCLM